MHISLKAAEKATVGFVTSSTSSAVRVLWSLRSYYTQLSAFHNKVEIRIGGFCKFVSFVIHTKHWELLRLMEQITVIYTPCTCFSTVICWCVLSTDSKGIDFCAECFILWLVDKLSTHVVYSFTTILSRHTALVLKCFVVTLNFHLLNEGWNSFTVCFAL